MGQKRCFFGKRPRGKKKTKKNGPKKGFFGKKPKGVGRGGGGGVPPFSVKKKSMKNWLKNGVFWAKIAVFGEKISVFGNGSSVGGGGGTPLFR